MCCLRAEAERVRNRRSNPCEQCFRSERMKRATRISFMGGQRSQSNHLVFCHLSSSSDMRRDFWKLLERFVEQVDLRYHKQRRYPRAA